MFWNENGWFSLSANSQDLASWYNRMASAARDFRYFQKHSIASLSTAIMSSRSALTGPL
jgi:hypothetical protein